jgi:hypothetical protein
MLKTFLLLTIILNIIIEMSITSSSKQNFSVEHLFKNKQSSRDFWLADDENKKQLWTFLVLYFINKNQYINDTYEKLIYSKDNECLENHVVWTTCIISPCWNFVYRIIESAVYMDNMLGHLLYANKRIWLYS